MMMKPMLIGSVAAVLAIGGLTWALRAAWEETAVLEADNARLVTEVDALEQDAADARLAMERLAADRIAADVARMAAEEAADRNRRSVANARASGGEGAAAAEAARIWNEGIAK